MDSSSATPDQMHDGVPGHVESDLVPADAFDPVIEAYKRDVDRTLLRENLKLTPQQRSERLVTFMRGLTELRRAERAFRQTKR